MSGYSNHTPMEIDLCNGDSGEDISVQYTQECKKIKLSKGQRKRRNRKLLKLQRAAENQAAEDQDEAFIVGSSEAVENYQAASDEEVYELVDEDQEEAAPEGSKRKRFWPEFSCLLREDFPKGINLAIIKENFPANKIFADGREVIKKNILQEIDKTPEGQPLPKILFTFSEKGVFIIVVGDSHSVKWIEDTYHNNDNVFDGYILKVMHIEEVPKFVPLTLLTTDTYTSEESEFLRRLDRLNPHLQPLTWYIVHKKNHDPFTGAWYILVKPEQWEQILLNDKLIFTGIDIGKFNINHFMLRRYKPPRIAVCD